MAEENLGELLSKTNSFFFKNLRFLSKCALIITILTVLISFTSMLPVVFLLTNLKLGLIIGASTLPLLFIIGVVLTLVTLCITIMIFHKYIGEDKTFKEAWGILKKKMWALVVTSFIASIFLSGLYILLIIPGIIFTFYWMFAAYSVLFREKKGRKALNYSKSLVVDNWWRVFLYTIFISILTIIASFIIYFPLNILESILSGKVNPHDIVLTDLFSFNKLIVSSLFLLVKNFFSILLGYFSLIFSLGLFLSLERKKGFHESELEEHSEGVIKDYIKKYMKNYTKENLKTALLKSGYSEKLIDNELDEHYS